MGGVSDADLGKVIKELLDNCIRRIGECYRRWTDYPIIGSQFTPHSTYIRRIGPRKDTLFHYGGIFWKTASWASQLSQNSAQLPENTPEPPLNQIPEWGKHLSALRSSVPTLKRVPRRASFGSRQSP